MSKEEIKEYLKNNLEIKVSVDRMPWSSNYNVVVEIYLEKELVSEGKDFLPQKD